MTGDNYFTIPERPEKLCYNVGQAADALGCSKSMVYHKIACGDLPSRRVFGRVVVLHEDLARVVAAAAPVARRAVG